jgi:hypothetical protein
MAARARGSDAHGGAARVSRAALGLLLALFLAFPNAAAADEPSPLETCGPLERKNEAVELPIIQLRRLGGTKLGTVGVITFRSDRAEPIPFQIEERRGRKTAMPGGPEPTEDDRPGELDPDDLLVFMACDAGERRDATAVEKALAENAPIAAWREIQVTDPLDHRVGYVYLAVADRPPVTTRRYVAYEPRGDLVNSARYRIGLVNALPTYFSLIMNGVPGPNLLDGLRLRAEATLRADLAHWTLSERQGSHELIAWRDGPVRVIRRSRHQVAIGLGIKITAGIAHTYFYPRHVVGPGSLKLPFSPGILFRDITAFGGADVRDLRGWRYYAPGVPPKGFLVDGHMDDAESAFQGSGDWFALARGEQALLFVTRMSENLARAIPLRLVYRDDETQPYPPEDVPGTVPLVGYEGRHVETLSGGRYQFALHVYVLDGYHRGDERHVIAQLDTPLTVAVTAAVPEPSPKPNGRGPDADARKAAR